MTGVAKSAQDTAAGANDAKSASGELSKLSVELQTLLDEATAALNVSEEDKE